MMGNLSFHSMHLKVSSEAQYPPLGGAQWSESRNAAGMVTLRVYCNEKQIGGTLSFYCCAQVCFGFLSYPCGLQTHEYLNRKGTSSKHQSKPYLFNYWPQI